MDSKWGVSANPVSVLSNRLAAFLPSRLEHYAGLVVAERLFHPANLPAFSRYCLIISPSQNLWTEERHGIRQVQDVIRLDLYALVQNFHATNALYGTVAPHLGLFELVSDIKAALRTETFDGLLDKTFDEAGGDARRGGGPVQYHTMATSGFDAGEHSFIYRSRIPFLGRMQPYCHARAS